MAAANDIRLASELLRQGRLVAFPTETVYGLGADAMNPAAIDLIYATKGRPSTNPLIVHVPDAAVARTLAADWPDAAQRLADRYWPGPLTIVLRKREAIVPDNATAGLGSVAIRVPNHPVALELLGAFNGPVAAPSANRSTRISPTTAQHVRDEFPTSAAARGGDGEPSLILDGGPCQVGIESTVLDLTAAVPTILRPGRVAANDLREILGDVREGAGMVTIAHAATSPGQQETHYAPRTTTFRFETSQRGMILPETADREPNGILVLSSRVTSKKWGSIIAMPNHPDLYARHLYRTLRDLDEMGLHTIYVEMPPADRAEWAAIRDRLTRASRPLPTVG